MRLEIKRLDTDLPMPRYAHEGDAGLDLFAAESCHTRASPACPSPNRHRVGYS